MAENIDGTPEDEKTIDLGFAHRISALYMYALISSTKPRFFLGTHGARVSTGYLDSRPVTSAR